MLRFFNSKAFRGIAIVAVLIALYAVAGFVIAPKLVRSALLKDIPENMAVTPSVGEIHINPFLMQVTVADFALAGAGGEKLVGFQRLFVDFELSSIWHRAYSFANIDLTAPYVGASVAADGALNLMQLKPKPTPQKSDDKDKPLPRLRIASLKVSQGVVSYQDRSRPDVFAARLEPINFELREFTTGVEGGKFTFTGSSKQGERLEWHGHVSVEPLESDGEFRIDGLQVHTLWEYLQDRVSLAVNSGSIDVAATYKFSAGNGAAAPAAIQVDLSKIALTDLTVRPKASQEDWIILPGLTVTGTTVDVARRRAHVDLVAITGLKLLAWLEPDGSVNLAKLTLPPPSGMTAAASAQAPTAAVPPPSAPTLTATHSAPESANPAWQFELAKVDVRDASLSLEDRSTHPAVKVLLAPLALQITGVSQDLGKPVDVTLETRINDRGSLSLSGDVVPQPAVANLNLKVADVDLALIQPYVARRTAMTLLGGSLGAAAKLHYGAQKGMPALQFAGNLNIDMLHTVDNALKDDFINWDRLDILGMTYSQGPDRLDIERILARKLYARVIIESDATMNVKRVLVAPTAPGAPPTAAGAATPATATGAKTAAAPPLPMSIKKIVVEGGQMNFTDMSVTPNFSAGIQALAGTVTGLSSKPGTRAQVDLKGQVDAFSPVSISGEANFLGPLYTDMSLSFRNISLAVFDPYSGKFAGYNITKGKLSTEFHYKVDGRKLDAQHHVVIEQLEFGDKTASKDAVSLPIKLGVALLKDRNGVIDLNLPVQGSLDDPEFRLAPIIWKVFVNILEKAVTAPFALLGSLFGGGPDIQFIDFKPGVSILDAAATDKAKAVAKALVERPQLKIEVPIAVVNDVDRPALVAAKFSAEIAAAEGAKGGLKKAAAGAATPFDQLDGPTQLTLLTQMYARDFGGNPTFPESITGMKSKPDMTSAKVEYLGEAIRAHLQVADGELTALGQQRALALQSALLTDTQVDSERVFLVANDKAVSKDGVVRLELSLQ